MIQRINRARSRDQSGFTLIELLVVIIILGILAAVVVFAVGGVGDKGKRSAYVIDARTIRTAEEAFCAKFGRYADGAELVQQGFLSEAPTLHTVTATPAGDGGGCTGAGDQFRAGYALVCTGDPSCDSVSVAAGDGFVHRNNVAQWSPTTSGVFETLYDANPDFTIKPVLADSYEILNPANAGGSGLKNICATDNPGPVGTNPSSVPPGAAYAFSTGSGTNTACSPYPASHTFRFHIRTNGGPNNARITFHDGVPLTAMAVKLGLFDRIGRIPGYNPTWAGNPDTANDSGQLIDNTCTSPANCIVDFTPVFDNLRVPQQQTDPGSLAVESPNQRFFEGLFGPPFACYHFDPNTGAKVNDSGTVDCGSDAAANPIGTGPYKFVQWTPFSQLKVTRNDGWWQGKAATKNLTFFYGSDANAQKALLQSGAADILVAARPDDVAPLRAEGFALKVPSTPAEFSLVSMNMHPRTTPPPNPFFDPYLTGQPATWDCATIAPPGECHSLLSDVNLRRAVSLALNRESFLNGVYGGQGTTQQTYMAPALLRSSASKVTGYSFDQTQANSILTTAGWTFSAGDSAATCTPAFTGRCRKNVGGRELRLTLVGAAGSELPLIQSQLGAVGIGVEIATTNPSAFSGSTSYFARITAGQGDLYFQVRVSTEADPGLIARTDLYTGPSAAYDPGPYANCNCSNPSQPASNFFQGSPHTRFGPSAPFNEKLDSSYRALTEDQAASDVADAVHQAVDVDVVLAVLSMFKRSYMTNANLIGFVPHASYTNLHWHTVGKILP